MRLPATILDNCKSARIGDAAAVVRTRHALVMAGPQLTSAHSQARRSASFP